MNLHQAQSHDVLRSWQSQRNDFNNPSDFVLPLFIGNDDDAIEPINSMPEVYRYGNKRAIEYLKPLVENYGLKSVLLFPVVTKSDKVRLEANTSSDEDDPKDIVENFNQSTSSQSSSQSSISSDEETTDRSIQKLPEILYGTNTVKPQNPFVSQNEGEEVHLLGEQSDRNEEINYVGTAKVPPPPPRANETVRKISKAMDIKLIKGLALKDENNPVLRLIPQLRAKYPSLLIICDVCLCAFTSTGHCCIFEDHTRAKESSEVAFTRLIPNNGSRLASQNINTFPISNKITCQYLAMLSVEYARRGCTVIAPSDMMDGRILTIRQKLDEHQLQHVSIMSYSAKFASAFYGPFRDATENAPGFDDRRAYQLPTGSRAMALRAVQRDIQQGADFVMVKPGGPYLDIVREIRDRYPDVPVAVYQVSGEYSMLKCAAENKIVDLKRAVTETLTAFRRSGATIIISYFTPEILKGEL